jgi:hypothetical protein
VGASRAAVASGGVALTLAIMLVLPGLIPAARAAGTRPVILSMWVSHAGSPLPARGAGVRVTVRVRYAQRCTFLRQRRPFASLRRLKTVSCANGRASVMVPAIKNPYHGRVRLTYAVRAVGANGRPALRRVRLRELGAPSPPPSTPTPPTASLTISPQSLPYTGGSVTLTHSSSNATSCSLSASPALWSGSNPLSVPCNGSTNLTGIPSEAYERQWTLTFTATSAAGQSATANGVLMQAAPPFVQNPNWSGYVVPSSSIVTQVSGRFTVPTLNCSQTPNAGESTWVGIGGYKSSGDLLQTGVTSDCVGGIQADDPAWWEEYPEVAETDFAGMSVSPGDQIQASVYESSSGTAWVTCVDDVTTGVSGVMVTGEGWGVTTGGCTGTFVLQGSTASLTYAGGYTAEWIVEDYELSDGSVEPFADYGTVTFTALGTSLSSWSLTTDEQSGIVQGGSILSVPSAPSGDGFSVTYTG